MTFLVRGGILSVHQVTVLITAIAENQVFTDRCLKAYSYCLFRDNTALDESDFFIIYRQDSVLSSVVSGDFLS